jgi:phospholipid/cholesterol/gamma-HCH transport system permease protein
MISSNTFKNILQEAGNLGYFLLYIVKSLVYKRPYISEIIQQSQRIGLNTLPTLGAVSFFVGANVALTGFTIFKQFGGQNMVGVQVGVSCVIGMSPIIVGAMMGAKPGTEMTATIASMRVKEQIDALEVMAVDPFWYLIIPRLAAYLIVTPALVVYAYATSMLGGYLISVYQLGVNPGIVFNDLFRFLTMDDFFKGIFRAELFALVIGLYSCYYGFYSRPGPAGVSRAINLAIVVGSTIIMIINYFLTEMLY